MATGSRFVVKKAVDLLRHSEAVKRQQITSSNADITPDVDAAVLRDRLRDNKKMKGDANGVVDFIERKVRPTKTNASVTQ